MSWKRGVVTLKASSNRSYAASIHYGTLICPSAACAFPVPSLGEQVARGVDEASKILPPRGSEALHWILGTYVITV